MEIILHARKSVLIYESLPWQKKNGLFDVTMGSYDGAEVCELIGCYLLSKLQDKYKNIGLYRDDGLAMFDQPPREIEKLKSDIAAFFREEGFKVTIEANKRVINYLDITFDLNERTFRPYTKPNGSIIYVNRQSNHPPSILKNLPSGVNKRLSTISSSEEVFAATTAPFQEALRESGYEHTLQYSNVATSPNQGRKRRRNILWYNPPYDINVRTNLGRQFLRILHNSFPNTNPLHKLFNKNTVKISYSCMPSIKNIVNANNKKVLEAYTQNTTSPTSTNMCNCRDPSSCPLEGSCKNSGIVYQATVESESSSETYVGLTENTFKTRFNGHQSSLRNANQRNSTELSKHVWDLKDASKGFNINWKILTSAKPYSNASKYCALCIAEKYFIIYKSELATLNKRSELLGSCRHAAKYSLRAKNKT